MAGKTKQADRDRLKRYHRLRETGIDLSGKIPEACSDFDTVLPKIARTLGMSKGNQVLLEDEEEINFLIDFCFFEALSVDTPTMAEQYAAATANLTELEQTYLAAGKQSYTSLFKVIETQPAANSLVTVDLLSESDEPISILNVNLSKSAQPGHVIFSRLLPYEDFNAFSGMFAAFRDLSDRFLLKRYHIMKKRVKSDRDSVQKFVACFKLHRRFGMTVRTR